LCQAADGLKDSSGAQLSNAGLIDRWKACSDPSIHQFAPGCSLAAEAITPGDETNCHVRIVDVHVSNLRGDNTFLGCFVKHAASHTTRRPLRIGSDSMSFEYLLTQD